MSPIVEVKDFSFKYRDTKRRAVKHVDFQVEEGSFFTIIGANGAGKSTLMKIISAVYRKSSGTIFRGAGGWTHPN